VEAGVNTSYWEAYIRARVRVDPVTGCWNWTLSCFPPGYGQSGAARSAGLDQYAHRLAFTAFKGPIPKGKLVRHWRCHNPPCCNPAHLVLGTRRDNMLDNLRAGLPHTIKLTPAKVARIRKLIAKGEKQRVIAEKFGVKRTAINRINTGRRWATTQHV
jgi:hypothetical protein